MQSAFDLASHNVAVLTGEQLLHILSTSCILSQVYRRENSAVELVQALCDLALRFFVERNSRPLFASLYGSVPWFQKLCTQFGKNDQLSVLFEKCIQNSKEVLLREQTGQLTIVEQPEKKISSRHPYRSIQISSTGTSLHDWYALGYQLSHLIEFVGTPELEDGIVEWQKKRRVSFLELETVCAALCMLQAFLRHEALVFPSWCKECQEVSLERWKKEPEAIGFKDQLLKKLDAQGIHYLPLQAGVSDAICAGPVGSFKACLSVLYTQLAVLGHPGLAADVRYKNIHKTVTELVSWHSKIDPDTRCDLVKAVPFTTLLDAVHCLLCPAGFSLQLLLSPRTPSAQLTGIVDFLKTSIVDFLKNVVQLYNTIAKLFALQVQQEAILLKCVSTFTYEIQHITQGAKSIPVDRIEGRLLAKNGLLWFVCQSYQDIKDKSKRFEYYDYVRQLAQYFRGPSDNMKIVVCDECLKVCYLGSENFVLKKP